MLLSSKSLLKIIIYLTVLGVLVGGCGKNEPSRPQTATVPIETIITAGPSDGETLVWGATATFNWKGEINPGDIIQFQYTLTSVVNGETSTTSAAALQRSISYANLAQGTYTFSVASVAVANEDTVTDSSPATRSFTVGAAAQAPPAVAIISGPKEKSFTATGADVFLSWESTAQTGRELTGFAYRLIKDGVAGDWSDVDMAYTSVGYYDMANGKYTLEVKSVDNAGQETVVQRQFEVKTPDVLFAIESLTATDVEFWHENVLRDFAYEDYHVSDAAALIAKLDPNVYSTVVWAWKNDYSAVLDSANFADVTVAGTVGKAVSDYLQAGGHLWIVGSEVMWGLDDNNALGWTEVISGSDTSYVTGINTFAREVLHAKTYNEDDADFQGANSAGVGSYNSIVVDGNATFAWCDVVEPFDEAETILVFSSGVFDGQSTAIRYPAGASNPGDVKVIFCGFYITDSTQPAAVKTTDIYELATTIFNDLGENLDW
ncbi:hypothetical protein JW960_01075 [candidate division KSB1 bacterium]|nr:hypothetical protein [candidate division KSB1 bacterium]